MTKKKPVKDWHIMFKIKIGIIWVDAFAIFFVASSVEKNYLFLEEDFQGREDKSLTDSTEGRVSMRITRARRT